MERSIFGNGTVAAEFGADELVAAEEVVEVDSSGD